MIASTSHQDWLFYFPLAQQAALARTTCSIPSINSSDPRWWTWSANVWPQPRFRQRTGRTGIAPDRLLRCCVMKHLKGWSFRDLERELRGALVYRRFTHFDAEATRFHYLQPHLCPTEPGGHRRDLISGWSVWPASKA